MFVFIITKCVKYLNPNNLQQWIFLTLYINFIIIKYKTHVDGNLYYDKHSNTFSPVAQVPCVHYSPVAQVPSVFYSPVAQVPSVHYSPVAQVAFVFYSPVAQVPSVFYTSWRRIYLTFAFIITKCVKYLNPNNLQQWIFLTLYINFIIIKYKTHAD